MNLHDLKPAPESRRKRKRVGRGTGSGMGKTAGRGSAGYGARAGAGGHLYRQGGNLPFFRKLPFKRGFTNFNKIYYTEVNVDQLEALFDAGTVVNPELLVTAGFQKSINDGPFVLLARGEVSKAFTVQTHRVSAEAKRKIEAAGGTVELLPLE
jgi:large subunit ribosomal protein L15